MKPLKLEMTAFGPYAEKTVIDYRVMNGTGLFLITGVVGAGKTQILDGMCFALFGEASGTDRTVRTLRSDFASPETPTEVYFDWTVGEKAYRVHRFPEQEVPKKRGDGFTTATPQATIWDRTGLKDDAVEGKPIATGWKQVTQKVEEIFGFQVEQFRQVIMIPQGQFRKLLTSDSAERQKILDALFETGAFKMIESALQARAKAIEDEMSGLRKEYEVLLRQAGVETIADLDTQIEAKDEQLVALRKAFKDSEKSEAAAHKALSDARLLIDKFVECEKASAEVKELLEQGASYNEKRRSLSEAENVKKVLDLEGAKSERESDRDAASESFVSAEKTVADIAGQLTRHRESHQRLVDQSSARELLAREVADCEGYRNKIEDSGTLASELRAIGDQLQTLQVSHDELESNLPVLQSRVDEIRDQVADREKQESSIEGLRTIHQNLQRALVGREKYDQEVAEEIVVGENESAQKKIVESAQKAVDKVQGELAEAQRLWDRGQAALLAKTLADGSPCPVCGSEKHPVPAKNGIDIPEYSALEVMRASASVTQSELEAAKDELSLVRQRRSALQASIKSLLSSLGDNAKIDLSDLQSQISAASSKVASAEAAIAELTKLRSELKVKTDELDKGRAELARLVKEVASLREKQSGVKATYDEKVSSVPDALRDLGELGRVLASKTSELKMMTELFDKSKADLETFESSLGSAQATFRAAEAARRKAVEAFDLAKKKYVARLVEVGYEDEAAYLSAKSVSGKSAELKAEIETYDSKVKDAQARERRAQSQVKDIDRPQVEVLEAAVEECRNKHKEIVEQGTSLRKDREALASTKESLGKWSEKQVELDAQYAVFGRLSEVSNGKNPLRMTFQRYVIAFLLEDVLVRANQRLEVMSQGRYQLYRSREQVDRRVAGGLDLDVLDGHTGKLRTVKSLSGGEGFLASLSLALGLSDVVQEYSGGIRLDTIFIDEGFGSLDSDALDFAIRTLIDLQSAGRLVGIISHVESLKERLPVRLEVSSTIQGSTAEFVGI